MVALRLELDNVTNLPDGGPASLEVQGRRSVDIGRNTYLDWTLPDPSRVVSGKHCEIHYRDGGYWLTDVSTNGTYLNGSDTRLTEPTRLNTGDRISIGDYLINVTVEEDEANPSAEAPAAASPTAPESSAASLWDVPEEAVAPQERRDARRVSESTPVHPDVLDWMTDIPEVAPSAAWSQESTPEADAASSADPHVEPADTAVSAQATPNDERKPERDDAQAEESVVPTGESVQDDIAAEAQPSTPIATLGGAVATQAADTQDADSPTAQDDPWITNEAVQPPTVPPDVLEPVEVEQTPEAVPSPLPQETVSEPDNETPLASAFEADIVATPPEGEPEPQIRREPEPQPTEPPQDVNLGGFAAAARAIEDAEAPRAAPPGPEFERFMTALAEELDVPRGRLENRSPEEMAQRLGQFIQLTIAGMQRLLKARATSQGHLRSGPGTQVQAVGNNPLKFMPTPAAAADVLFGPPSRSYLSVEDTLDESFADLGAHQMALYAAMQGAVERMLRDLEPETIEAGDGDDRGFSLPGLSSRKAKFWDTYKERYTARASQHDNGMVDVFMMCFSDAYSRALDDRS